MRVFWHDQVVVFFVCWSLLWLLLLDHADAAVDVFGVVGVFCVALFGLLLSPLLGYGIFATQGRMSDLKHPTNVFHSNYSSHCQLWFDQGDVDTKIHRRLVVWCTKVSWSSIVTIEPQIAFLKFVLVIPYHTLLGILLMLLCRPSCSQPSQYHQDGASL